MEKKSHSGDHPQKTVCFAIPNEVPSTPPRPSRPSSATTFANPLYDIQEATISSHKLYVSNLPENATFGDLQHLFPKALTIVLEHHSRETKTAIVEFDNWKICADAFKAQKNSKLGGRLLIIAPKTSSYD